MILILYIIQRVPMFNSRTEIQDWLIENIWFKEED